MSKESIRSCEKLHITRWSDFAKTTKKQQAFSPAVFTN
jgi:hypothetical protein